VGAPPLDGAGGISRRQCNGKFALLAYIPPYEPTPAADRRTSWRLLSCYSRHVLVRSSEWPSLVFPGVQGGLRSHRREARDRFAHHSARPIRPRLVPKQAQSARCSDLASQETSLPWRSLILHRRRSFPAKPSPGPTRPSTEEHGMVRFLIAA
jgi:hypothetical protein